MVYYMNEWGKSFVSELEYISHHYIILYLVLEMLFVTIVEIEYGDWDGKGCVASHAHFLYIKNAINSHY